MNGRAMSEDELEEIRETVVTALLTLVNVAQGDCSAQLEVDLQGSNPLSFLLAGINDLIFTLGTEQEQSAVFRRELDERLATIEQQRSAIRSLSTPVIEVWRGVLCLPVVGVMDTQRSAEMTSALLITAALGAMVLAHRERLGRGPNQREWSKRRFREGEHLAGLPAPGVYARHNAVDTPALLPDGTPSELSVSRVLTAREQNLSPEVYLESESQIERDMQEGSDR